MLRRTCLALSPKLKMNNHPKTAVRWRPGNHFWKPKYGASKMKWNFTVPYVREVDSLYHYPEKSAISGEPINWMHDEPNDGYDGTRNFGEHTLELKGMPFGRTPEYMQERLRRFFSKFGPVVNCRAEPHSLDPYQCQGTAWVTFRDTSTALKALRAPLKFPASLHDKVVNMKHLDSGKKNDPDYFEKSKFWNVQLLKLARDLHSELLSGSQTRAEGKPLYLIGADLLEHELVATPAQHELRGRGGVPPSKGLAGAPTRLVPAGPAVKRRFGSWEAFLAESPFDELFSMEEGAGSRVVVKPRLVSATQRVRIMNRARRVLARRLHEELSLYWREGRIPLPEYTQRRVDWWDHKPPLPFEVQIQSRTKDRHKIFDEKFIFRRQLIKARNEQRNERRAEWAQERKKQRDAAEKKKHERYKKAISSVEKARCSGLLGRTAGLVPRLGQRREPAATRPQTSPL